MARQRPASPPDDDTGGATAQFHFFSPLPVDPSDRIPSSTRAIAAWVVDAIEQIDFDVLADEVVDEDMRIVFFDRLDDQGFIAFLRSSVVENLGVLRTLIADPGAEPAATVAPRDFAAEQARLGMPATALQHSYRIGVSVIWRRLEEALAAAASELGLDAEEALAGLREVTVALFDYHNAAMQRVAEAHAEEEAAMRATQEQQRQQLLRELLDDETTNLSDEDLSNALRYDVRQCHVAAISHNDRTAARAAVRSMAADAQHFFAEWLMLMTGPKTLVLWLGRPSDWSRAEIAQVGERLSLALGDVSIGTAGKGASGLRQTYLDAVAVERVRDATAARPPGPLSFAEVQLDALALADRGALGRFVEDQLGPLTADDDEMRRLRETLSAWYETGGNVSAAAVLGVHEHTVRNRLRRAEELLDSPVNQRRLELQTALRLFPLLETRR